MMSLVVVCHFYYSGGDNKFREAIKPGTERNGMEPEVIDAQYGRGRRTRGQKLALIRTVCLSVQTLISRSVAATKTEQAPAESHVKRMNC